MAHGKTETVGKTEAVALVTGGSGYLARWTILALLAEGYRVRTTLCDPRREAELRTVLARHIRADHRLSVHVADIGSDAGWTRACEGCRFVVHAAASAGMERSDRVRAAGDGARRVLHAAEHAGVRRVVMTSPASAASPPADTAGPGDERCWTDLRHARVDQDTRAQILAEREAWAFIERTRTPMALTTVLPGFVLGPLIGADYPASVDFLARLLQGRIRRVPRAGFNVVDVRDLAALLVRAMVHPQAAGQRFLGTGEFVQMGDIVQLLRARFPQYAAKLPARTAPDLEIRVRALFDADLRSLVPELGKRRHYTAGKAAQVLGWRSRNARESIIDGARSLILSGCADPEGAAAHAPARMPAR
ncbi:NAD-dependent epimerase/dehydratase family protein [Xanthomonas sp. AmX2]|uniref:NAD-dependent epimerase/dehydratase family protein n=1 Tax=Xanthomonas sp. TaxID=29446 RepID=UPI00197EFBCC|nr:NAD-dependent epimerase/dehydratase family protein [Xanthomonas sp.]MBN6149444.1 NAD-dependent epimerase/dehydratase family protein [Xanthomonas sp.]